MLAKIVKSQQVETALKPERIRAFSLRDLGSAGRQPAGVSQFVFPAIERGAVSDGNDAFAQMMPFSIGGDLESAQDAASSIIAQAESDKEMIERAAYEKGLNEAMAEVEKLAAERATAAIDSMRQRLAETIAQLESMAEARAEQAETDLITLAVEIARKVIHREASTDREIVVSTARAALAKIHSRSAVEIRLHPQDHEFLLAHQDKLGFRGSIGIIPDASVSPGGCLVHTENGDVDATVDSQLEEILSGLLGNDSEMPIVPAPIEDHSQTYAS